MDLWISRLIFGGIFWVLFALPLLVLLRLPHEWLESNWFRLPAGLYFIAWHLAAGWLGKQAARNYLHDGEGFIDSIFEALSEARVPLSFLPVVGRLFAPRR
jgi:hypothetical protein